jgi:hypothetical protein
MRRKELRMMWGLSCLLWAAAACALAMASSGNLEEKERETEINLRSVCPALEDLTNGKAQSP